MPFGISAAFLACFPVSKPFELQHPAIAPRSLSQACFKEYEVSYESVESHRFFGF